MKLQFLAFGLILIVLISCTGNKLKESFDTKLFNGNWVYRSLLNIPDENVPFSRVDTSEKKECKCTSDLEFATAVMKFDKTTKDSIFGILDMGQYGILNLSGKITLTEDIITFELQGDGVPNSNTNGWQYNYRGFVIRKWENGINQLDACVGSVIRSKDHSRAKAGKTASFYMVKK